MLVTPRSQQQENTLFLFLVFFNTRILRRKKNGPNISPWRVSGLKREKDSTEEHFIFPSTVWRTVGRSKVHAK
jgi:hypothetical protein